MDTNLVTLHANNARKTVLSEIGLLFKRDSKDYHFISQDAHWLADWAFRIINSAETAARSGRDGEETFLNQLGEAIAKATEASARARQDIATAKARQATEALELGRGT